MSWRTWQAFNNSLWSDSYELIDVSVIRSVHLKAFSNNICCPRKYPCILIFKYPYIQHCGYLFPKLRENEKRMCVLVKAERHIKYRNCLENISIYTGHPVAKPDPWLMCIRYVSSALNLHTSSLGWKASSWRNTKRLTVPSILVLLNRETTSSWDLPAKSTPFT